MKKSIVILSILINMTAAHAQDSELPYREIPPEPEAYTSGAVLSRMIDGLGFRFYWATDGLTVTDLSYKASEEARTTAETLDHILGLSQVILSSAKKEVYAGGPVDDLSFDQKRAATLQNLKMASEIFLAAEDLSQFKVEFKGEPDNQVFPLWNQINGPIADAIWHCGQIVQNRRASGNPFSSKVRLFTGKMRN